MAKISAAAPWRFWVLMYERISKMTNADGIGVTFLMLNL